MKYVIAGDTDSAYISLKALIDINAHWGDEDIVTVADDIGEEINDFFPQFMDENFCIGTKRGRIIQAGREVIARRGLFKDVKKRYALHVINNEGKPDDKMKIMGMEVRRSDTPKIVQDFLTDCLTAVVKDGKNYDDVREMVDDFRYNVFRKLEPWERGTPGRVSNLASNARKIQSYQEAKEQQIVNIAKPKTHYSVMAANNTNLLMKQNDEHRWDYIRDGDKISVLYLKPNPYGMNVVAIKVDETYVPEWFKELPFDNERHEKKMIDQKLFNVLGSIMDWSFEPITDHRQEVFEEVDLLSL